MHLGFVHAQPSLEIDNAHWKNLIRFLDDHHLGVTRALAGLNDLEENISKEYL